jgi:hypothetical protein
MIRILSSDLPSRSTNITYTTQKMHLIRDPFGEEPKSKAVINKSQTRATERDSPRYSASLSFALICLVYSKASGDYTAKWTGNETGSHISAFKGIPEVIQKLKKEPCSQKKTHVQPMHRDKLCSTTYIEVKRKQVGWNTLSAIQDFNAFTMLARSRNSCQTKLVYRGRDRP